MSRATAFVASVAPGLLVAIALAAAARFLTGLLPRSLVSEVTVAILLGLIVGRLPVVRSARLAPGLKVAAEKVLRLGIVLIGATLSIAKIAAILPALPTILVTMAGAIAIVLLLSRAAAVDARLATLLAVGMSVCGNTAVVATTPVIGARPRDTAYAVATVTLFGTLAVFAYPLIGHAAQLPDPVFGLWSGIAINDTSQVVAASSAYSPGAFDVATVVKLIRNALMAPLIVGIAWQWSRRFGSAGDTGAGLRRAVPLFVLGFLALAGLRSAGAIDATLAGQLEVVARALILVALAAVGLNVRLENLREVGPRPLLIGLGAAVIVGAVTILAILTFGLASGLAVA